MLSFLLSRDKRAIYLRKIKGFWIDYSHNKVGFLGLLLLLLFVGVAIFAPLLTPYDPVSPVRVADAYAMPSWMRIFPQYSDYPETINIIPVWKVRNESELNKEYVDIEWGTDVKGVFHMTRAQEETIDLYLDYSFDYLHAVQPNRFTVTFEWSALNITNARFSVDLFLVNTEGNATRIWDQPSTDMPMTLTAVIESTDYWLIKRLGYGDPKTVNLAHDIFASPTKGRYTLLFHITFEPDIENEPASIVIGIKDSLFSIPGLVHGILGTEYLGLDVFSQLVYGTQLSLIIGLIAAVLSTSIGVLVGIVAGFSGGTVDEALMRTVDILLCLPVLPLLLTLVMLFGKNVYYIVLLIAVFGWQGLSRTIRSHVLSIREATFIESATAAGAGKYYIMRRHLLPNVFPIAITSLILSVPGAILTEAGLSFLGFGDPRVPTWGKMLNYAFGFGAFENLAWWYAVPPGIAITVLSLAFVFIGFAMDEIVNPRLRRRR